MPGHGESAIAAQIHTHTKAALCLIITDLRLAILIQTPHIDLAVYAAAGDVLAVCAEGNGPGVTRFELIYTKSVNDSVHVEDSGGPRIPRVRRERPGVPTADLPIRFPCAILALAPYSNLALKSYTRSPRGISRGHEVVNTKGVHAFE